MQRLLDVDSAVNLRNYFKCAPVAEHAARALARVFVLAIALAASLAATACAAPEAGGSPASRAGESSAIVRDAASRFEGRLLRIHDGDSFVVALADGSQRTIRLAGIDAPERDQPWADASRAHLESILSGRALRIEVRKRDRYGRLIADVLIGTGARAIDVALAQLEAGLAWHFRRYESEQPPRQRARYARAERDARAARIGLWQDDEPIAPDDFRGRNRRRN